MKKVVSALHGAVAFLCFAFCFTALTSSALAYMYLADSNQSGDEEELQVSDGPYVFEQAESLTFKWLCDNKLFERSVAMPDFVPPYVFQQCELDAEINRIKFAEDFVEYQGDFDLAALSDLHGQYDLMLELLTNNQIIDEQGNWAFGTGHFVITGDIFDRGDKVTEILWFIYKLEQQAEQAGGKVHLLLGNHEVMVLNGDLRYLHPKYVLAEKLLKQPFESLFGEDAVLGRWLRSKSVLVKINNMLFAHGGFHPELAKDKRTLAEINSVFKQNLVKAELHEPREGFARYLHKSNGPIWYRGYFKDNGASSEEIELLLQHFDVEHLIVGHTSQPQIETRFNGKVIAIDSSIKRGNYGEILLLKDGEFTRGTLSGKSVPLIYWRNDNNACFIC